MRRRREISDALATAVFDRLSRAPIGRRANIELYRQASAVADELGWAKTYDAEYVALARRMRTRLITRDERLQRGAGRLIEVVGPDDLTSG
jgi:predicted nucleic acid-binding protein